MDGPSPPNAAWVTPWIGTLRAPQLAGARPVGPASGRETQLGSCRLGTTVLPGSSCSGDRRRSPMREAGWAHPSLPVPAPAGTPPPPVAVPKASNGGAEGPASAGPQPEQPKRQDGASSPCPLTARPGSEPPGPGPAVPQPWVRAHRGQGARQPVPPSASLSCCRRGSLRPGTCLAPLTQSFPASQPGAVPGMRRLPARSGTATSRGRGEPGGCGRCAPSPAPGATGADSPEPPSGSRGRARAPESWAAGGIPALPVSAVPLEPGKHSARNPHARRNVSILRQK